MTLIEWRDSLLDIGAIAFPGTSEVNGLFSALIGSRPAYASVVIKFESANEFEIDTTLLKMDSRSMMYAQYAIFGALDVFMTVHTYAISKVKITVIKIEEDEVKSTPRAFRLAGREAARRALTNVGLKISGVTNE